MRAWIETLQPSDLQLNFVVARRVRAWIETLNIVPHKVIALVARRVRAWIETYLFCQPIIH